MASDDDHASVGCTSRQARDDVRRLHDRGLVRDGEPHAQVRAAGEQRGPFEARGPGRIDQRFATHAAHDLAGCTPADRLDGSARQVHFGHIKPLGVFGRLASGREGIARVRQRVDAAALDAARVGPSAIGPHGALGGATVSGIGEDDQTDRTGVLGELRLVAAEVAAVPSEADLAAQVHACVAQLREVGACAVVHIDDFARHVAAAAVGVPGERESRVRQLRIDREVLFAHGQPHDATAGAWCRCTVG